MKNKKIILFPLIFSFIFCISCSTIEKPDNSQIAEAYQDAKEAMALFKSGSMEYIGDGRKADGHSYYLVVHDTIKTLSDLKEHLKGLFIDDIINNLLSSPDYRDIDGSLYTMGGVRGTDITKGNMAIQLGHDK